MDRFNILYGNKIDTDMIYLIVIYFLSVTKALKTLTYQINIEEQVTELISLMETDRIAFNGRAKVYESSHFEPGVRLSTATIPCFL